MKEFIATLQFFATCWNTAAKKVKRPQPGCFDGKGGNTKKHAKSVHDIATVVLFILLNYSIRSTLVSPDIQVVPVFGGTTPIVSSYPRSGQLVSPLSSVSQRDDSLKTTTLSLSLADVEMQ